VTDRDRSVDEGVVFIDGERRTPERAVVSVYDRGFLYGDSVFEVVRTYGGKPFGLEDHVARLHASAHKLAMHLPWSEAALVAEILDAVRTAGFSESYVRVVVTRGSGPLGLDLDLASSPMRVVLVHRLHLPARAVYADGVALYVVDAPRATDGTAAQGAKASNYLANLLALHEAKTHGAFEPLFVERDVVLEGGTSNVFAVKGSDLFTPPLGRILGGITRKYVLEAAKSLGMRITVAPLALDALLCADEVFITSTIREVVPVVEVIVAADAASDAGNAKRIGDGRPGPVTRALHRGFRSYVGAPSVTMPWE
jgi:branched-chain amino acid aminotransferase